jgi:hypothetical protein
MSTVNLGDRSRSSGLHKFDLTTYTVTGGEREGGRREGGREGGERESVCVYESVS